MSLRDIARGSRGRKGYLSARELKRVKKRGYDAERELVKKLRRWGFEALRVPVSAPSREPLPDVFAVRGDTIIAFEVKSHERYAYYKRSQVSKLHEFLKIHRIYPKRIAVLAAKFKYRGWFFLIVDKPRDYSLKAGEGLRLNDLIREIEKL